MKKLYATNAVWHSLAWLAFYLVLNTITDNLAAALHMDFHAVTAIPNLALAAICLWYLRATGISEEIGLLTTPAETAPVMLYYVPLLALPFFSLTYGINTSLSVTTVVLLFAMYSAVGFMEEIIFRGLMFKALAKKWNRYVVVVFISLTFAVGHIVSMVAIAQSGSDTVLQVVNAGVVGFMFMAVILASGNLTICVIAHILYNFLANISLMDRTNLTMILFNTVVTALYFAYLVFRAKNVRAFFTGGNVAPKAAA